MTSLLFVISHVLVQGPTTCPSPAAVTERLAQFVTASTATAQLAPVADGVAVTLTRDDEVLAARTIRSEATCEASADAVAVFIASWQSELRSGDIALPEIVATRRAPPRVAYRVGAAFLGAVATTGAFAAGGTADVTLSPWARGIGGKFSLFGAGNRLQTIGQGHADWTRVGFGIGAAYQFAWRRVTLAVDAQFVGALVLVAGHGFAQTSTSTQFDPGLAAGMRFGVRTGFVTPFIGIQAVGWPRAQVISSAGPLPAHATLPQFEVAFLAGLTIGNKK